MLVLAILAVIVLLGIVFLAYFFVNLCRDSPKRHAIVLFEMLYGQAVDQESVARTLIINQNYCLTDSPIVAEEKWIKAKGRLVQKMGAESYLATVLSVLRCSFDRYLA